MIRMKDIPTHSVQTPARRAGWTHREREVKGMIEVRRKLVRRAGQIFPVREVEFVREGATLAALVEGDPLLQALDMPLRDVERLRSAYAPAISNRPLVSAAFDVILECPARDRQTNKHSCGSAQP